MKIPKYIQNKMSAAAHHHRVGINLMREVESWLEAKGMDIEKLRQGWGYSLEEIDLGNDVTQQMVELIEVDYEQFLLEE